MSTGEITKSKIKWTGECEFKLSYTSSQEQSFKKIPRSIKNTPLKTKILAIGTDYYLFESRMEGIEMKMKDTIWFNK